MVLAHLRVRMRAEEADDLVTRYAHADGTAHAVARDPAGDHVRVAGGEAAEELEDGDLEGG